MFDAIRDFLARLGDGDEGRRPARESPELAAVALFFSVINADGEVTAAERSMLRQLVARDYAESDPEAAQLLRQAEEAELESVDLYGFTRVLNRRLSPDEKTHFIELLWELAYADGVRHELEDHVVWRIADLMGVDGRDRVSARQRVATRRDQASPDAPGGQSTETAKSGDGTG
ncbi:TerB family tellurite resistance protein [Pseudohoeflea coraliihabitans]|uniref:TerB family tellurite resistance protein n=1 Tax=Pseudohoeflea coraliihabitans TaxID=2860393 RepID=A0ABS6WLF6_9HYPH|nr:TerB family tellurite resistance protein [Pseudohoeflea sp. DP4N28-3]MBW3096788.1 TerB family tellurite resistance protein [Pseudohoeflea sp. DP4N28-3]